MTCRALRLGGGMRKRRDEGQVEKKRREIKEENAVNEKLKSKHVQFILERILRRNNINI